MIWLSKCSLRSIGAAALALILLQLAHAATPTPELQKAVRAATFEVVIPKAASDPLSYEKPLPLDLIPYVIRSDHYWSIGTAFAIAPDTYVSAAHVLLAAVGSQFGAPSLRDSEGHVYPVKRVLKFSAHEDFIVFTIGGAPAAQPLATSVQPKIDDVVFAAGNALGEGVVIRDGLLTSETPEAQDGRWKWLRFSAAASPGNSGGPLLDASGRVIGVVSAKSPNENLNYALPIARVLDASGKASFDLRYSSKLPNARFTQVATLKTQFDLPQDFSQFAANYQALLLSTARRDVQQLLASYADRLFPHGNSTKLLATVYDSPLLTFVQQDRTDAWDAVGDDNVVDQDLPGHGLVTTGTALQVGVFRLRRPDAAIDGKFYEDPRAMMDLLLKGLKLTRPVGDQQIRITSLGQPQSQSVFEDTFGRHWQVSLWPLGYTDNYVICYALPVPEGYQGMLRMAPSTLRANMNEYLKLLANYAYVNYSGTLPQWQAFLARRSVRPKIFDGIQLEIDASQNIHYRSPRLTLDIPKDLIGTTVDSQLVLPTAYMLSGEHLAWDVGGLYLYKDQVHHTYVGIERHVKPADDSAKDQMDVWNRMSTRGAGFEGVAGHDDGFTTYWIHNALSAPTSKSPGIDPAASVLYDVFYTTDAESYPRDLEDGERRLLLGTHILER
jgi:serine protease Do